MLSNCLIQAIKAKKETNARLYMVIPSSGLNGFPHFVWYEGDVCKHFTFTNKKDAKYWWKAIWYNGHIEEFPTEFRDIAIFIPLFIRKKVAV